MIAGVLSAIVAGLLMIGGGWLVLYGIGFRNRDIVQWNLWELVSYGFVCGIWLWLTLLTPLLLHGATPFGIGCFITIAGAAGMVGLVKILPRVRIGNREWLGIIVVGLWSLPYALFSLAPNTGWDAAELHLPLARLIILEGNLQIHPVYYKFAITGGMQQIYGLFQYLDLDRAVAPFNFFAYLVTLSMVYGWTRRRFDHLTGGLALAVTATIPLLAELGIEPRIDGFLALFATMAIFQFADGSNDPRRSTPFLAAAIGIGAGLATKYTMGFILLLMICMLIIIFIRHRFFPMKTLVIAALLLAAPSAFWYLRNAMVLRDPVYPYLSQIRYPGTGGGEPDFPFSEKLRETLDQNPGLAETPAGTPRTFQGEFTPEHALNVPDILLHPSRYTRKPGLGLSVFLLFFLFYPLFAGNTGDRYLYGLLLGGYLLVGYQTYLIRYLVFFFPGMAACSAAVLAQSRRYRPALYLVTVLLGVNLAMTAVSKWQQFYAMDTGAVLIGKVPEDIWLTEVGYNNSRVTPRAIRFMNRYIRTEEIPGDHVLMMIGDGKGDRLKMPYIPDGSWSGHLWQYFYLLAGGRDTDLLSILYHHRIHYIMLNRSLFNWVQFSTDADRASLNLTRTTVTDFLARYGETIYRTPYLEIARICYPPDFRPAPGCPNPMIPVFPGVQ